MLVIVLWISYQKCNCRYYGFVICFPTKFESGNFSNLCIHIMILELNPYQIYSDKLLSFTFLLNKLPMFLTLWCFDHILDHIMSFFQNHTFKTWNFYTKFLSENKRKKCCKKPMKQFIEPHKWNWLFKQCYQRRCLYC